MRKDKNGKELVSGDTVSFSELVFKITEFKINMKGVNVCGVHGCFNIKDVEKVEEDGIKTETKIVE